MGGAENPGTCVDLFYGNREIPWLAVADGAAVGSLRSE
jgi:hypothetical protein